MESRFSRKAKVFDIGIAAVAAVLSVGVMLDGVFHYGLSDTWPELVINLFYIACLVMMGMYFFNSPRITTQQFNYWSSMCVGATILLRDILFPPPMVYYSLHLSCLRATFPNIRPPQRNEEVPPSSCRFEDRHNHYHIAFALVAWPREQGNPAVGCKRKRQVRQNTIL